MSSQIFSLSDRKINSRQTYRFFVFFFFCMVNSLFFQHQSRSTQLNMYSNGYEIIALHILAPCGTTCDIFILKRYKQNFVQDWKPCMFLCWKVKKKIYTYFLVFARNQHYTFCTYQLKGLLPFYIIV